MLLSIFYIMSIMVNLFCKSRIDSVIRGYEGLIKQKKLLKKWFDVAYLKGYQNGHLFVVLNGQERAALPQLPRFELK